MTYTNRDFKYSTERFWVKASIADAPIETGEVAQLSGSSVSAKDKDGTDCSTTFLDQSTIVITDTPDRDETTDTALAIIVRNGSATKSPYTITFTVQTTLGQIFVVQQTMMVKVL